MSGIRTNMLLDGATAPKQPRKTKPWDEKSWETQRKEIAELADSFANLPRSKLLLAVAKCMKKSGEVALSNLINYCAKDPTISADILTRCEMKLDNVQQIAPQKALSMLLDANLSKQGYEQIGKVVNSCGKHVLPCYDKIREAKQECAADPQFITITDTAGYVELHALLQHTIDRIVKLQRKVLLHAVEKHEKKLLTLDVSWGMDGSSGYSNYKQGYDDKETTANQDSSVFAIAINPLRLHSNGCIYWNNPTPQSYRFCRPLKVMFAKETKNLVLEQIQWVEDQISKLEPIDVRVTSKLTVKIRFDLHLTVIDGKVLSIIRGTSCQTCPVCLCTPVQFNVEDNLHNGTFAPKPNSLIYGMSVLHSYIRVFEYLLKIAYRLSFKQWQAREEFKELFNTEKHRIQQELWGQLKLRVDYPNPGGSGNSNDGNTARRAFQNYQMFARVLNIREDVVSDFRTILVALASQFPINPTRFKNYCHALHDKLLKEYGWYRLPSSVHKLLVHGSEIIEASPLPVGVLSEDCAESRNKFYKFDRTHRARKTSRTDTMSDVFYRGLHTSDPFVSSLSMQNRSNCRKRSPLPQDVISLLDESSIEFSVISHSEFVDVEAEDGNNDLVLEIETED